MMIPSVFIFALGASVVLAAPAALERRCYVGDADPDVIDAIYRAAANRGANSKVRAFEFASGVASD